MTDLLTDCLRQLLADVVREVVREELRTAFGALSAQARSGGTPDEYLSVSDAAKTISVNKETVREWVRFGHLKAYRAGRLLRVRRADLESFMAREEERAGRRSTEVEIEERATAILRRRA